MNAPKLFRFLAISCFAMLGSALPLNAQWTTQTINLQPGWNAVYLQVQPEPADCDSLLASLPIESVWLWNRRHTAVQFIQDAEELVPTNPDWLVYLPPAHPLTHQTTLYRLLGGKSYLIHLDRNATPIQWTVRGRPSTAGPSWVTDSFNFVGFDVDPLSPPSYHAFFGPSAAHNTSPYYRLRTDGLWEQVPLPNVTRMIDGQAFWLWCRGRSIYPGPIDVTLEQATGLDFGRFLNEQTLVIRNAGSNTKSIRVRILPSASPPLGGAFAPLGGDVPLSYWFSSETVPGAWTNLPAVLIRNNLSAGAEWRLRLAVRRQDMLPEVASANGLEPLYQSLLEVTESAGSSRHLIPVSAYGLTRNTTSLSPAAHRLSPSGGPRPQNDEGAVLHAGLWVGSAVITHVNQPGSSRDPVTPRPTKHEFQFRLIVHVSESGQAHLLQKVLQMWKTGTYKPDPADPTKRIVDVPGRFVLLTDETLAAAYSGAALRDGQPVGRRFSSAAFGFRTPLPMSGAGPFGAEGSAFACTAELEYRDPLNPFVHRYHPDHDNLNESFATTLKPGREAPTVTRKIDIEFTADDPDRLQLAGWGSSQLGGLYAETITGLHKAALHIRGTFRLHRASNIPALNDGSPH